MGVQLLPLVLRIGMSTVQGKMQQWQLLAQHKLCKLLQVRVRNAEEEEMQQWRFLAQRDHRCEEQQRRQRERLVAVRVGVVVWRGNATMSHTCSSGCGDCQLHFASVHVSMVAGWGPDSPCRHWLQLCSSAAGLQHFHLGQLWCIK